MKTKVILIVLIPIVLLALAFTRPKRIQVSDCTNEPLKYSTKIYIDHFDKVLAKQRYNYSTNINKKYISLITLSNHNAEVQEYIIEKDGSCDISVPKDTDFIISLPAYSSVAYTWDVNNSPDKSLFQFVKKTRFEIPKPLFQSKTDGGGYQRENLYFKSLNEGIGKLVLRYEHHIEGQNQEYFETNLNITVK